MLPSPPKNPGPWHPCFFWFPPSRYPLLPRRWSSEGIRHFFMDIIKRFQRQDAVEFYETWRMWIFWIWICCHFCYVLWLWLLGTISLYNWIFFGGFKHLVEKHMFGIVTMNIGVSWSNLTSTFFQLGGNGPPTRYDSVLLVALTKDWLKNYCFKMGFVFIAICMFLVNAAFVRRVGDVLLSGRKICRWMMDISANLSWLNFQQPVAKLPMAFTIHQTMQTFRQKEVHLLCWSRHMVVQLHRPALYSMLHCSFGQAEVLLCF